MRNGFAINVNGERFHYYVNVQAQLPDLPTSLRMKQFNGKYGYSICYHPGENNQESGTWVYLFEPNILLRTPIEVWNNANLADIQGSEVFGVKGKSVVLDIMKVPNETPLDYMHLVLGGVEEKNDDNI